MSTELPGHAHDDVLPDSTNRPPYTVVMTDVGTATQSRISIEDIAKAIAQSWHENENTSVELLTPTAVYLYERRLVEWVCESAQTAAELSGVFEQIRKRGIEVAVVLPMPELGRAHEEFWGTGLRLYGWIDRGDNVIRFTGPEVA
ncbi:MULTISPECIES: hypothetical protein [Mycolicibacterium]|uniref:hypothetical protein n=1 Tax=Mycolicibacterium TaxID=1866885 RepID=UPI001F1DAACF|nr:MULTISPECIES: hypothetical protein [Mycolicibacterium]